MNTYVMAGADFENFFRSVAEECIKISNDEMVNYSFVDGILFEKYGLLVVSRNSYTYHATDEKKLMEFILKYGKE